MKGKRLRIVSLVVLLGLIAAIPASTQGLLGSTGGGALGGSLPLLVLVNRMELTPEQMEAIHGLLVGLVEAREALELRQVEFEQEMAAFTGTAADLDETLEAFRAEMEAQVRTVREYVQDAIDRIKGILTVKQGEVLAEALPGLMGDRAAPISRAGHAGMLLGRRAGRFGGRQMPFGPQDEELESTLRGQLLERLEEHFAGHPEVVERLRQRLGGSMSSGALPVGMRRGGFGMPHRNLDWIEQLVEVLELKLEAIG
jgi:hypothetical protein